MDHSQTPQSPQPQATEDITPQHIEVASPSSGENSGAVRDTRSQTSSVPILHATSEGHHTRSHDNPYTDFERIPSPRPTRSRDGHVRVSARRQMSNADLPAPQNTSGIDWIVPVENKNGVSVMFISGYLETCLPYVRHARRAVPSANGFNPQSIMLPWKGTNMLKKVRL